MFTIAGIGFAAPWLLLGLIALPILWFLLRAVPPAPIHRFFPGVALLLGLQDDESQTDKTPWWLLLLRTLAIAAMILGFAGPVLNPSDETEGSGPLLILTDATWADAPDWDTRITRIGDVLDDAARLGRPVKLVSLTSPPQSPLEFQTADVLKSKLAGLQPNPWEPDQTITQDWVERLDDQEFDTYWLSDGLARDSREPLLDALSNHGTVTIFESPRNSFALRPAEFVDGEISITALRANTDGTDEATITAHGLDPAGIDRPLATDTATFTAGSGAAELTFDLPPELRNRITRFSIDTQRSAGATTLTDDALKRREVALISGRVDKAGLALLAPTHFLEKALEPTADLIDGSITDILLANPDVIVLADVATLAAAETEALAEWITNGGLLLRFAGVRLAASDVSREVEDLLMPVRLRAGGRTIGGAMSWGEPKSLQPFPETSPFFGLTIPDEIRVTSQVMAQPDPDLASRTIAALSDGTPLVTRKPLGDGQIVLFHVTANAEWSNLPLSGLFVQMLERLAVSTLPARPEASDLAGTTWVPTETLNAFGELQNADNLGGITGENLANAIATSTTPPGLYSGADRRIALNVIQPKQSLSKTTWPASITVQGLTTLRETALKGTLLAIAIGLLAFDMLASLWLSGRLSGPRSNAIATILAIAIFAPDYANAQTDDRALDATTEVVFAYVITGDPQVDNVSNAGLIGLSDALFSRTSIEPVNPIAINLETDELSFFPFIYWAVTPDQPTPSPDAYTKLNRYLRSGGMVMFDTRDANTARFGTTSPNGRKLQILAAPLDIPPLEPVPEDHVLTRAFYLLQDFPGRHISRDVWVEAAPPNAELIEGMPFRNLNDNVTPVIIGGNDWASAWAVDNSGNPMFPIGRGSTGERQREIAIRFGINLIMHVLTGNYKSDQVHVPALLERLEN